MYQTVHGVKLIAGPRHHAAALGTQVHVACFPGRSEPENPVRDLMVKKGEPCRHRPTWPALRPIISSFACKKMELILRESVWPTWGERNDRRICRLRQRPEGRSFSKKQKIDLTAVNWIFVD